MEKNKIAALLLIISAIIFIFFVLFIEKVSDLGVALGSFAIVATGALFSYLYWHRYSKAKRWLLLLLFIVPSIALLLRSFLKA